MKTHRRLVAALVVLALGATPALALASSGPGYQDPFAPHKPGPSASTRAKAKAYGKYCRSESKSRVKGLKSTPYGECLNAMARLATHKTRSAGRACAAEPKRHVKGMKSTPYAVCVAGGKKLLRGK